MPANESVGESTEGPADGSVGAPADESPDDTAGAPADRRSRFLRALTAASPAIGAYLVLRMISLEVLIMFARLGVQREPGRMVYWDGSTDQWRGYTSALDVLLAWDGRWYVKLAEFGYTDAVSGTDEYGIPFAHRLAFSPLYPYLARSLTWIPGVNAVAACLIVSLLSSIAAAWALYAIGTHMRGRRFGIILASLWAVVPVCFAQNGAFTESLFIALVAWALWAVLTRRWVAAGVITAAAGLTRVTALAIIGTVGLAAIVAIVTRRDSWRPYAALCLAPLGYLGYVAFVGHRLGSMSAFFDLHRNVWGTWFDYGQSTFETLTTIALIREPYNAQIFLFSAMIIVAVAVSIVLAAMHRTPWILIVFATVIFIGSMGSHAHISLAGRHLMPAFPALIVPAIALSKARTRSVVFVLFVLAVASGWYGGWLPFASGHAL